MDYKSRQNDRSSESGRKKSTIRDFNLKRKIISLIGITDNDEFSMLYSASPEEVRLERMNSFNDGRLAEYIPRSTIAVLDSKKEGDTLAHKIDWIQNRNTDIKVILIGGLDRQTSSMKFPRLFSIIKRPLYHDICTEVMRNALDGGFLYEKRIEPRIAVNYPVEIYFVNRFWQGETLNLSLNGMQTQWNSEPEEGSDSENRKKTGNLLPASCIRESQTAYIRLYTSGKSGPDEEHLNLKAETRYTRFLDNDQKARIGFEFKDLDQDLRMKLFSALEI